jgi:hypothetical protein
MNLKSTADDVFQKRHDDFNDVIKDRYGIYMTKLNDLVLIHHENKKKTEKFDYIGRVVRTYFAENARCTVKKDDIEILWERSGQIYKSPRLSKKQAQWVRHTQDKHLFIDTLYYVCNDWIVDVNGNEFLFEESHFCSTVKKMTVEEEFRDQQLGELGWMDYENIDNRVRGKGAIVKYYNLPNLFHYLKPDSLINDKVGPNEVMKCVKMVFKKFPYDIYRNVMSYL